MANAMSREELIRLVNRICEEDITEQEQDALVDIFRRNIPHPAGSDLIFWPSRVAGLGDNPTTEQIVDVALSYKPIQL